APVAGREAIESERSSGWVPERELEAIGDPQRLDPDPFAAAAWRIDDRRRDVAEAAVASVQAPHQMSAPAGFDEVRRRRRFGRRNVGDLCAGFIGHPGLRALSLHQVCTKVPSGPFRGCTLDYQRFL